MIIEPDWVEAAQKRSLARNRKPHLGTRSRMAIQDRDHAELRRLGSDCMGRREAVDDGDRVPCGSSQEAAQRRAWRRCLRTGPERLCSNGSRRRWGLSRGLRRLVELGHSVTEIRGGQPAVEPEDLVNRRSEWYWNLRPRFENCEIDFDPDDDVLAKQLVAIKWKMTSKGQIAVETKEERRKRELPVT